MFTSKSFIFPFCHRLDQYWLAHNHTPASGNSYSTILSFCRWKNSGAERKCLIQMPQGVFMNGTVVSRFLANYSFYHTRPIIIGNLLYSFSVVLFRLYYYWFQIQKNPFCVPGIGIFSVFIEQIFIQCLLGARHCSQCLPNSNSFDCYNNARDRYISICLKDIAQSLLKSAEIGCQVLVCVLAQAALTKCHRLGGFNTRHLFLQDQDAYTFSSW